MIPQSPQDPLLTLIGSSNFNYRSLERDVEAQVCLLTHDPSLKGKLEQHLNGLYQYSEPVQLAQLHQVHRAPPLWVKWASALIQRML